MENIIKEIKQKQSALEKIDSQARFLDIKRKEIEKDIYSLKIQLRPFCDHENKSGVYKQRVTPSKELDAQICLLCGQTIYLQQFDNIQNAEFHREKDRFD